MKTEAGEDRLRRSRTLGWVARRARGARDETGALATPLGEAPLGRLEQPVSGTHLTDRISIFHDDPGEGQFACTVGEVPELRLTVYHFGGSYASLAIALRNADLSRATPSSVVSMKLAATATRPLVVFLRLNLRAPDGTETLNDTVVLDHDVILSRFDLAGARCNLQSIEAAWLDVIFSEPEMCEIDINRLKIRIMDVGRLDD